MDITIYKHAGLTYEPNYIKIPVTTFPMTTEGAHKFNEIYDYIKSDVKHKIVRTKSGGISIRNKLPLIRYDIRALKTCVELTVIHRTGLYRFQIRSVGGETADTEGKSKMFGRQAFRKFKDLCAKEGIDLDLLAIDNGVEVKKEIEKPLIKMDNPFITDVAFKCAHHIDFHNSYPAGLCNTHPEFRAVIEPLYKGRKDHPENKQVLNLTVGFMQSVSCCGARWANLSRDAINDNNKRVKELAARLKANGRQIISYNTDGIWYAGEVYHGEGEGSNLGEWSNDHQNCLFRAKSAGCYEYIENDKYTAVVRGYTKLDKIKPRTEWQWGDIYQDKCDLIIFTYVEGEGIFENGVKC